MNVTGFDGLDTRVSPEDTVPIHTHWPAGAPSVISGRKIGIHHENALCLAQGAD
jgi:hypothetical protein